MATLRQQLRVFIDRELSPSARAQHLARQAREGAARLIAEGRASPRFEVFVDGRRGAALESVNPDHGTIVHEFSFLGDAALFALAYLQERAPVGEGTLSKSFMIAVNGRGIRQESFDPSKVPADAEIIIFSPLPYSRKADVQLIGKQRLRFNRPAEMYANAAAAVRRRFGNSVTAKRIYTFNFPGQYRRKEGQVGRLVEHPGIEISARL